MSVEDIKRASGHLRGDLAADLAGPGEFGHDSTVLLKFHGIYQQDDRDVRRARASQKLPLDYSCMVRASVPGGRLRADQWLALDRVADLADGTLRLTTRQGVQFHLVHKASLAPLVRGINEALLTTLAACGDVSRNVMACPWPDERQAVLEPLVAELVGRFRPRTTAYWELWVNGERAVTAEPGAATDSESRRLAATGVRPSSTRAPKRLEAPASRNGSSPPNDAADSESRRLAATGVRPIPGRTVRGRRRGAEPIYGEAYLPRKFKIAVAWPGDNCVDVLANDVGLVPTLSDGDTGAVTGYAVFVGGGLGMSHAREEDTYPRLAVPLGWVPPERVVDVVEAVVTIQRDHGNREDRQRARLKYTLETLGLDAVRAEVSRRVGFELSPPVELPPWVAHDHHGTHGGHDSPGPHGGVVGLPVPSGKVVDRDGVFLRRALRELTRSGLVTELRVTPRDDLLLHGIPDGRIGEVEAHLRAAGVALAGDLTAVRRLAIACPALPTCGQALGEAERVLPDVVSQLEKVLADTGNGDAAIRVNMTGCPNGCARPYTAEIGIVGRSKKTYDVYVGGSASGDRLAARLRADVPLDEIPALLAPVLERYARDGHGATFGDWTAAAGTETVRAWLPAPEVRRRHPRPERPAS